MSALPTTSHVQAFLRVHMETAAYDAAHSDENGHGPLGQRYSLWQSCIDHLELLESNEAYAAHFADLVIRHNTAKLHAGDPAGYRAALAELGLDNHRFDDVPAAPTDAQLDGTACLYCGRAFGIDEANYPAASGPRGQLFAHSDTTVCDVVDPEAYGFDLDDVVNVSDVASSDFGKRGTVVSTHQIGNSVTLMFRNGATWSFRASQLMHHAAFVAQMDAAEQQAAKDAEVADDVEPVVQVDSVYSDPAVRAAVYATTRGTEL